MLSRAKLNTESRRQQHSQVTTFLQTVTSLGDHENDPLVPSRSTTGGNLARHSWLRRSRSISRFDPSVDCACTTCYRPTVSLSVVTAVRQNTIVSCFYRLMNIGFNELIDIVRSVVYPHTVTVFTLQWPYPSDPPQPWTSEVSPM